MLWLQALQTGRESEATLSYKEALKLGLDDTELLRAIGRQQLALGKLTLAEGTLRRVRAAFSSSGMPLARTVFTGICPRQNCSTMR